MKKDLYETARRHLEMIRHPRLGIDIVSAGCIRGLTLEKESTQVVLELGPEDIRHAHALQAQIETSLRAVSGIQRISCVVTTHQPVPPPPRQSPPNPRPIPGVSYVIAVASGKGGVGKSTTTVNLAVALSQMGLRVGLLDADVYGPSLPHLLDLREKPLSEDGKTLQPLKKFGLSCMSIGFLIPEEKAAIWRGPMAQSALQQMLRQVEWGELDILVVDMPPGTGDIQLTLSQTVTVTGAIFVSTPQDLALIDVRRGIQMFQRVGIPILGLIENMSYFSCPVCAHRSPIFHHGGAHAHAQQNDIPFLAEVPLDIEIRQSSDDGIPLVVAAPDSPVSLIYRNLAKCLWENVS